MSSTGFSRSARCSSSGKRLRRANASASASSLAPASSKPVTDAKSSRACGTPFSIARLSPSSCGALAAVSLPVTPM